VRSEERGPAVMTFEDFAARVTVYQDDRADEIRRRYIDHFVNTNSDWFQERIAVLKPFKDGLHYTRYLWDCLKHWERISEDRFFGQLRTYGIVNVFWDLHSSERIFIEDYWKFPKASVLQLDAHDLEAGLEYLPEDIYIFNEDLTWSLILTHEYDNGRIYVQAHTDAETSGEPRAT